MKANLTLKRIALFLLLSTCGAQFSTLLAQGTAFTYQGRLSNGSNPAGGNYDFRFTIWNAESGGSLVDGTVGTNALALSNGLFTLTLDFGAGIFTGADRWLEINVRTNGTGSFATLGPRQKLTATPYAVTAGNLVSSGLSAGTYGNAVTFSNSANSFNGTFNGNGSSLSNVNAATFGGFGPSNYWRLGGNFISSAPLTLGTIDSVPMTLIAGNRRVQRLESASRSAFPGFLIAPNLLGGSEANVISNGVLGATIAGGGQINQIAGFPFPFPNTVSDDFGSIGGGVNNTVGNTNADFADARAATVGGGENNYSGASHATVSGGTDNAVLANSPGSVISGGRNNRIEINSVAASISGGEQNDVASPNGTIGGGVGNTIEAGAVGSSIVGGTGNRVRTGSNQGTIGGGAGNVIDVNAMTSTIGGGVANAIEANAAKSTVGGGQGNRIQNSAMGSTVSGGENNISAGIYATVPGGQANVANGRYSFAAGRSALASHDGAFVWADSQGSGFTSTANDQFNIRAANGVRVSGSGEMALMNLDSSGQLSVFGTTQQGILSTSSSGNGVLGSSANANGVQGNSSSAGASGVYGENLSGSGYGIAGRATGSGNAVFGENPNAAGLAGYFIGNVQVLGNLCAFNVACASDRNVKSGFEPVNSKTILEKVVALPITRWHYTNDAVTPHIGPVAQDFHAAFHVGSNDKQISTVDADGVALAAIQGLNQKLEERLRAKEERLTTLEKELAELKRLFTDHPAKRN
jgi:hypothetical protein